MFNINNLSSSTFGPWNWGMLSSLYRFKLGSVPLEFFKEVFMLLIVGFKNILRQSETFGNGWYKEINTFLCILNEHISKCAFSNFEW